MLIDRIRAEPLIKSSPWLLKTRLWFFATAAVHTYTVAISMIPIDISVDEDPKVSRYQFLRWKFITVWFNLIFLVYLPTCLYCDWKESREEAKEITVSKLRRIRDVVFTSILFPTVMFADLMFWRVYHKDMSLITPPKLFAYMPWWGQHSLHTVSLVVVVMDLLMVPRRRPKKLEPRFLFMSAFVACYMFIVMESYFRGESVYQLLDILSGKDNILLLLLAYTEYSIYFTLQWFVIDRLWGANNIYELDKNCH